MADNLTPKEEFLLNPVTEHNITDAAIASFETNFKHPVKVTVPITPKQDLHGMPNPYPAGASVNLIPDGTDTENGYVSEKYLMSDGSTGSNANMYISEYIEIDPSSTYTWSNKRNTDTIPAICFYDANKNFISGININNQYSQTFTPPEGAIYCRSSQTTYSYQDSNSSPAAYQLELGSTATEYRRYSNICPIEGDTESRITNSNNLINFGTAYSFNPTQEGTGIPSPSNVRTLHPGMKIVRDNGTTLTIWGGTITVNKDLTSAVSATIISKLFDGVTTKVNSDYISNNYIAAGYVYASPTSTRRTSIYCDKFEVKDTNSPHAPYRMKFASNGRMFFVFALTQDAAEKGITSSNVSTYVNSWFSENPTRILYMPDNPSRYNLTPSETIRALNALGMNVSVKNFPITFTNPSTGDPMTVYGGTLTLNEDGSADLVEKWVKVKISQIKDAAIGVSAYQPGMFQTNLYYQTKKKANGTLNVMSDSYALTSASMQTMADLTIRGYNNAIYFRDTRYSNATALVAAMGNTEIAYEIRAQDRTTYHFPNVGQLKAFLGTNNIWSDIGNVNVKYLTQNSATGLEYRGDRALELRRRAMIGDAPTIHTTVGSEETGGLASFKSYIKASVKKIEIPFGPKQDLHGYDHPWPAGGGKNLFNKDGEIIEHKYYTDNGKIVDAPGERDINIYVDPIYVSPSTAYTISKPLRSGYVRIIEFDSNDTFVKRSLFTTEISLTITTDSTTSYVLMNPDASIDPATIQLELGSTATAYAPYENICPIEGRDGCMVLNGDERFNFETGEMDFTEAQQLGSGVPSSTNYRQIMPRVNITRDDGTQLVVYGGSITLNNDGTSVLIDEYTVYGRQGRYGWVNNTYNHWLVFRSFDATTVSDSKRSSDRFYYINTLTNSITCVGRYARSGTSWLIACPTEEIYNIIDDAERLNAFNAWLDANPTFLYLKRASARTYNLSVEETIRAFDCLGVDASKVLRLQWNYQGNHSLVPIQEGTGDPSPENVRPIHPRLTFTRDDDSVLSVYGGTLTVNDDGTSELTNSYNYTRLNSLHWGKVKNNIIQAYNYLGPNQAGRETTALYCNILKAYTLKSGFITNEEYVIDTDGGNGRVCVYLNLGQNASEEGVTTDAEALTYINNWLSENEVYICYNVKEPTTYTLSVTETNRALEALGLTQHIGSLYGGTVTINSDGSADVVAMQGLWIEDGSRQPEYPNWKTGNTGISACLFGSIPNPQANHNVIGNNGFICDSRKYGSENTTFLVTNWGFAAYTATNFSFAYSIPDTCTTKEEVAQYFSENPVEVVYPLLTPQTYHFSNLEQLKVWLGENNFWCDISDDITVKYWNRG